MKGSSPDATLLFFPSLHPVLAGEVPAGVRFLDPGLADGGDPAYLRPGDLALNDDTLAGFLREFNRLRQEVKNPKDLAMLAGSSGGHFFSDTSFAVREELEDQLHPERVTARRGKAAQLALCLSYMMEESLLELAAEAGGLDDRFHRGLTESLGLDRDHDADEEADQLVAALAGAGEPLPAAAFAEEFRPSWQQTLSPFWAVAPSEAGFFVSDPELAATWIDAAIPLAAPSPEETAAWFPAGLPSGTLLAGRVTGWQLLGKSRPNPEAPWLNLTRQLFVVKP
ncbi:MAG: hypothetical protein AB9872_00895 [Solidesulfovibrio sp.]